MFILTGEMSKFNYVFGTIIEIIESKPFLWRKTNEVNKSKIFTPDRKGLLNDIKKQNLKRREAITRYCQGVMIGKWRDKREINYITTKYSNEMETYFQYNKIMGEIGHQDQFMSNYPCERRTIRWYKKASLISYIKNLGHQGADFMTSSWIIISIY